MLKRLPALNLVEKCCTHNNFLYNKIVTLHLYFGVYSVTNSALPCSAAPSIGLSSVLVFDGDVSERNLPLAMMLLGPEDTTFVR